MGQTDGFAASLLEVRQAARVATIETVQFASFSSIDDAETINSYFAGSVYISTEAQ